MCLRPGMRREEKESGDKSPHSKGATSFLFDFTTVGVTQTSFPSKTPPIASRKDRVSLATVPVLAQVRKTLHTRILPRRSSERTVFPASDHPSSNVAVDGVWYQECWHPE